MIRAICFAILTLTVTVSFSANADHLRRMERKHLLVLHSYDPSYSWTNDAQRGIEDAIAESKKPFRLSLEYLDAKRVNNADYLASVRQYLAKKYANYQFDAIIVTDDVALRFLNSLELANFKGLPTVAVGIGDPNATLRPTTPNGVIIRSESHLRENIDLIRRLRPHLHNLYYLTDKSVSSQFLTDDVRQVIANYPDINLVEVKDLTLKQTRTLLQSVSPDDAVLLGHFNTELGKNIYYEYHSVSHAIGEISRAPVFVLWEFYITHGVLGGYVTRSYEIGVTAVKLATHQLIEGGIDLETSKAIFNYEALQKHHIDMGLLPGNALIIERPENFWIKNLLLLIISGGIIVFLLIVIFVLVLLLRRKRMISQHNSEIVALQNKTLGVQKDLIHVLGEAIESRSGETGNHVKRVAKISTMLAKLSGLTAEQSETIEIVSPMHDVGKIAIPESILSKPGKLTAQEWETMKSHAEQGFKLLNTSEGEILHQAAIIALEHHEHWDGRGYPNGKSGHDIHIYARITAVADVFDALLSERCYKEAWSIEAVTQFFSQQRGKQFDPYLSDLLLEHLELFTAIRNRYPDS